MAERNRSTWASARSGGGPFPEGFQVPPRCLDVPETQPGEQRGHLLRSESTQEERLHLPGNPGGLLPPRAAEEPVIDPVDRPPPAPPGAPPPGAPRRPGLLAPWPAALCLEGGGARRDVPGCPTPRASRE